MLRISDPVKIYNNLRSTRSKLDLANAPGPTSDNRGRGVWHIWQVATRVSSYVIIKFVGELGTQASELH